MGRRGRAGQGEGPSLSDLPGHDLWSKLLISQHYYGAWEGCAGRGGVAYTMVGCSSPSVVKGRNWTKSLLMGDERGRDGRVWGPSCSSSMGTRPKEAAAEGVDCGAWL